MDTILSGQGGKPFRDVSDDRAPVGDDHSVEAQLLFALKKCRLIRDIASCNYHRCGRTDKGMTCLPKDRSFLYIEL